MTTLATTTGDHVTRPTLITSIAKLDAATARLEAKAAQFQSLLADFERIDLAGHLRAA